MERTIDYKRVGLRLKELRQQHELTQSQLAEAVGCSDGFISQVERGISNPSLEFLVQLSTLYHLPVDHLLLGTPCVLPEIQIDTQIKERLDKANPATLQAIVDMIDILLAQQEAIKGGQQLF